MTAFLNEVVVPGLLSGATAGLFGLAFVMMYRVTGVMNFAQGQLVMLMPLMILVVTSWGAPVPVSFLVALIVVVAAALVEERIAIRPFINARHALPWILSTLGFSIVLAELMSIPYADQAVAFPWGVSMASHRLDGISISWSDVVTVVVFVALVAALMLFDRRTTLGLRLRAVGQNRLGAAALGISPGAASRVTALIAGLIAAVTGVLIASSQLVSPDLGLTVLFNGFIAAAVGGLDSIPGTLIGGLVVGLLSQLAATYVGGSYVNLALFGVLLVVYLVRPHGIFGHASVRAV